MMSCCDWCASIDARCTLARVTVQAAGPPSAANAALCDHADFMLAIRPLILTALS